MMTYRTNALAEKPVSSFGSTQSLGPLQSMQTIGPGQKQSLLLMKKKQTLRSSTERLTANASSMSTGSKLVNQHLNATAKVSAFVTKEATSLLKLNEVEEQAPILKNNSEETKTVQEETGCQAEAEAVKEPVAEVFRQRLVSHRR